MKIIYKEKYNSKKPKISQDLVNAVVIVLPVFIQIRASFINCESASSFHSFLEHFSLFVAFAFFVDSLGKQLNFDFHDHPYTIYGARTKDNATG